MISDLAELSTQINPLHHLPLYIVARDSLIFLLVKQNYCLQNIRSQFGKFEKYTPLM